MAVRRHQSVDTGVGQMHETPANSFYVGYFFRNTTEVLTGAKGAGCPGAEARTVRNLTRCWAQCFPRTLLSIIFLLVSPVGAFAGQVSSANSQSNIPATQPGSPTLQEILRPALEQVGAAAQQVQSDRWKVSREAKSQLRSDLNSIQQDLSSQLPTLFQAAEADSAALEPQLNALHNVDALYDVLVRVSTVANLTASKQDAVLLDDALVRLQSARKTAANQLLLTASHRDRELVKLQAQAASELQGKSASGDHVKTIVVNNHASHRTKHPKVAPHKKTPTVPSSSAPGGNPNTRN